MAVHVGDVGVQIIFDLGEDLASATVQKIKYRKPSGVYGEFSAVVDGTRIQYTTIAATDLDVAGKWTIQAYVVMTGWSGHSDFANFEILGNLG